MAIQECELSVSKAMDLDVFGPSNDELDIIEKQLDSLIKQYNIPSDEVWLNHAYYHENKNEYEKKAKKFKEKWTEFNKLWQKKCEILLKQNPYIVENEKVSCLIDQASSLYKMSYREIYDIITIFKNRNLLENDFFLNYVQRRCKEHITSDFPLFFRSGILTSNKELVKGFIESVLYLNKKEIKLAEKLYQEQYFQENPLELLEIFKDGTKTCLKEYLRASLKNNDVLEAFANQIDAMEGINEILNNVHNIYKNNFQNIERFYDNDSNFLLMTLENELGNCNGSKSNRMACAIMMGLILDEEQENTNDLLESLEINPIEFEKELPTYLRELYIKSFNNRPTGFPFYDLWINNIMTWISNSFSTTYNDYSFLRLFLSKENTIERNIVSCYLTIPEVRDNILTNPEYSLYNSLLDGPLDYQNHIELLTNNIYRQMEVESPDMIEVLKNQKLSNLYYYKDEMMFYIPIARIIEALDKDDFTSIEMMLETNSKQLPIGDESQSILLDNSYFNYLVSCEKNERPVIYQKK